MKTIYVFTANLMNGTVTIQTAVQAFTDKALAELTREAVEDMNTNNPKLRGLGFYCSDVKEIPLFESREEVTLLDHWQPKPKPVAPPPVILSVNEEIQATRLTREEEQKLEE